MIITLLTVFPAHAKALEALFNRMHEGNQTDVSLRILDIRGLVKGSFRAIDDSPYGGGAGMIIRLEPVFQALRQLNILDEKGERIAKDQHVGVVALTPYGRTLNQKAAKELSSYDQLVFICGHYEGLDQRIYSYCDEQLSVGDFVLSGGELAAFVAAESIFHALEEGKEK
ncbi:MAG: 23S rRNA (pseudouridine(1915)-N(3))-methyltransferase RlmH [Firmicutes bacterium]|nr:23S rRNA (pseudouridine(1915)-N(3))-methyltransferase RlmH [Bacillota bacterium]